MLIVTGEPCRAALASACCGWPLADAGAEDGDGDGDAARAGVARQPCRARASRRRML